MHPIRSAILRTAVALAALTLSAHAAIINVPADQPTIQTGINAANVNDTVQVAAGTYFENINFNGKTIKLIGAGAATTIIDGSANGPVVTIDSGEGAGTFLQGFTIRDSGPGSGVNAPAGGIYVKNSSPLISMDVITQNFCAGIYSTGASPRIDSDQIDHTTAGSGVCPTLSDGNAITINNSAPSNNTVGISNNIIQQNTAPGGTAGILVNNSLVSMVFNTIQNNTGNTIVQFTDSTSFVIVYNLISDNTGDAIDAMVPGISGPPRFSLVQLTNNTIANNTGMQVFLDGIPSQVLFSNNILYSTSASPALACATYNPLGPLTTVPPDIEHNDIFNTTGNGFSGDCFLISDTANNFNNIFSDPLFAAAGNYQLSSGSPAIDAGNNDDLFLSIDLLHHAEPLDATGMGYPVIDMGAYEFTGIADAVASIINLTPSSFLPPPGNSLTLTALVALTGSSTGVAPGSVTFLEDGTNSNAILGSAVLSSTTSTATFNVIGLTSGPHAFTATYPGAAGFPPAVAHKFFVLVTGVATTTTITSSLNPSNTTDTVTYTAKVTSASGTPTGSVIFKDGAATLATQSLVSGITALSIDIAVAGTHTITATYVPTGSFSASSASLPQVINGIATVTTLTANPLTAFVGQNVAFTSTVSEAVGPGHPSGSVQFLDGTTVFCTAGSIDATTGISPCNSSTLPVGSHVITAVYSGNAAQNTSTSNTVNVTILAIPPTTTTLTSSLNPASLGVPITFTATVTSSSTPTGFVTFMDGAINLGSVNLVSGIATLPYSSTTTGSHTITAIYTPVGFFGGSSNTLTQTITLISTHTTLFANASAFVGSSTAFNVAVSLNGAGPAPTGTITLMEGAAVLTTTPLIVSSGPSYGANPALNNLSIGLHIITAVYSGDSSYNPSTSNAVNITILINPTTLTLTASPNPAFATAGIALTAQITSSTTTALPIGGTVTFLSNGSPIGSGTITASGAAFAPTLPISNFSPGSYSLTATFAATTNFDASISSPVTEVINITPTITTLTVTPNPGMQNQAERLVAEVTNPLAPSTVLLGPLFTYFDGSVSLGTSQNGISISTLAPGIHTITATYVGDTDFLPSTSAPITLVIIPKDFTLTTPPTLTIQTEHHASLGLTLTSIGSFTDDIAFTCGLLPPIATCTFSSNPAHLGANATIVPSVLVETDAVPYFKSELQHTGLTLAMLLPFTLLTLRRRKVSTHLLVIFLTLATLSLTACSGKYPASTPPGTYNITVTALSQATSITHTANITFIVTP